MNCIVDLILSERVITFSPCYSICNRVTFAVKEKKHLDLKYVIFNQACCQFGSTSSVINAHSLPFRPSLKLPASTKIF
jgi:hypothetical protein